MNKLVSKRQVWFFIYSIVLTCFVFNYMRNMSFGGGFDQTSIAREIQYKIGKTFVNNIFFNSQLEQIKRHYPDAEISIKAHNQQYPVIFISVENAELNSLQKEMDSVDFKFNYVVITK